MRPLKSSFARSSSCLLPRWHHNSLSNTLLLFSSRCSIMQRLVRGLDESASTFFLTLFCAEKERAVPGVDVFATFGVNGTRLSPSHLSFSATEAGNTAGIPRLATLTVKSKSGSLAVAFCCIGDAALRRGGAPRCCSGHFAQRRIASPVIAYIGPHRTVRAACVKRRAARRRARSAPHLCCRSCASVAARGTCRS